jgi:hypothetical protein
MALAMVGLFAVVPPIAPLLWFALTLIVLFSAFSFLTIAFYAEGRAQGRAHWARGHLRLAGWREGGALLGVSLAAVAPVALAGLTDAPFAGLRRLCGWRWWRPGHAGRMGAGRPGPRFGGRGAARRAGDHCRGGFCCWRWSTRRRWP